MKDLRLGLETEVCLNKELELRLTKSLLLMRQTFLSSQLYAKVPKMVSALRLFSRESISRAVRERDKTI